MGQSTPSTSTGWKNGRTQKELNKVIEWLTGFDEQSIQQLIKENVSFAGFFEKANIHPNAHLITGVICGYRIEEIPEELASIATADTSINWLTNWQRVRKWKKS